MTPFTFDSYKLYLEEKCSQARGLRSQMAKAIGCQNCFVSQVLGGIPNFSLEHGMKINRFLDHDDEESHFFMLLLQEERAGTMTLKVYYKEQMDQIRRQREQVKNRIKGSEGLSELDQMEYYSHWAYAAIHILVSIPDFQEKEAIASKLKIRLKRLNRYLAFLVEKELIYEREGRFTIGNTRIHLGHDSRLIRSHHTNWRLEAIKSLDRSDDNHLHYSSILSMSKSDYKLIRQILLDAISTIEPILLPSPEEELVSMQMDFFTY